MEAGVDSQPGQSKAATQPTLLSEALKKYVEAKKNGKGVQDGYQELRKFVDWFGGERVITGFKPSEIADYPQQKGIAGPDAAERLRPVKDFLKHWKDKGWVENSLSTHLRIPRPRGSGSRAADNRAALDDGRTHLSQQGYDRLLAQLNDLKTQRVEVIEEIKLAMSDKDYRENAPLDAAKEKQGFIESQIRTLEADLSNAQILPEGEITNKTRSSVGAEITLKDMDSGKVVNYTLVDAREADVASGRISTQSPVGQALLDRMIGENVEITVPKGKLRYLVQNIASS